MPSNTDAALTSPRFQGTAGSEISSRLIKLKLQDEDIDGEFPAKEHQILAVNEADRDGGAKEHEILAATTEDGIDCGGKICTVIEEQQIVSVKVLKLTKQLHIAAGAPKFQYAHKSEDVYGCSSNDMVKETSQRGDRALEKLCDELSSLSIGKQAPGADVSSNVSVLSKLKDLRLEHICPSFRVEPAAFNGPEGKSRWKGTALLGGRAVVEAPGDTETEAKEAAAAKFVQLLVMTPTWARMTRSMAGTQIILELKDEASPETDGRGKRRYGLQDCLIPAKKYKIYNV